MVCQRGPVVRMATGRGVLALGVMEETHKAAAVVVNRAVAVAGLDILAGVEGAISRLLWLLIV